MRAKAVTHGKKERFPVMGRPGLGRRMMAAEARAEIRRRGFSILQARCGISKDGRGFICPVCGHGKGGDGVTPVKDGRGETFHCFGCGRGGDVFDFLGGFSAALLGELAQAENLGAVEPDQWAGRPQQSGAPAPPPKPREQVKEEYWSFARENLQRGFALLSLIEAGETQKPTPEESALLECARYIRRRGLSQEQAAALGFGCDPHSMPGARPYEILPYGGEPRIIYPCNASGGYQARAIAPNAERPKLTAKGEQVGPVGLDACNDFRPLWVTEGIFDYAVVANLGYPAVCLNGLANLHKVAPAIEVGNNPAVILATDADGNGAGGGPKVSEFIARLRAGGKRVLRVLPPYGGEYVGGQLAKRDLNSSYQAEPDRTARWIHETAARFAGTRLCSLAEWAGAVWPRIRRAARPEPLDFGNDCLNAFFAGAASGLTLVAAGTGAGKTSTALNLARMLCERGRRVIYAAYEQSTPQLVAKIWVGVMSTGTGGDAPPAARDIFGRDPGALEFLDSSKMVEEFNAGPGQNFAVLSSRDGHGGLSEETLLGAVDDFTDSEGRPPVLFVDYAQLMGLESMGSGARDFRIVMDAAISTICRGANDRGAPVFMLSAITRGAYGAPVTLQVLKESSLLEYSATCVCGIDLMAAFAEPGPGDLDTIEGTMTAKAAKWRDQHTRAAAMEIPRRMVLSCLKNRYDAPGRQLAYKYWPALELVSGWRWWNQTAPYFLEGREVS